MDVCKELFEPAEKQPFATVMAWNSKGSRWNEVLVSSILPFRYRWYMCSTTFKIPLAPRHPLTIEVMTQAGQLKTCSEPWKFWIREVVFFSPKTTRCANQGLKIDPIRLFSFIHFMWDCFFMLQTYEAVGDIWVILRGDWQEHLVQSVHSLFDCWIENFNAWFTNCQMRISFI